MHEARRRAKFDAHSGCRRLVVEAAAMCGVIGLVYENTRDDLGQIAAELLKTLEYRGYDSTGAAIQGDGEDVVLAKGVGAPSVMVHELGHHAHARARFLRPGALGHLRRGDGGELAAARGALQVVPLRRAQRQRHQLRRPQGLAHVGGPRRPLRQRRRDGGAHRRALLRARAREVDREGRRRAPARACAPRCSRRRRSSRARSRRSSSIP